MQPLSFSVFCFAQTAQASICQSFVGSGVTQVQPRSGAHNGGLSRLPSHAAANLRSQPSESFNMSLETILIIVLVVFLLGGGGWYWGRSRG
jgi:hypothetical protein